MKRDARSTRCVRRLNERQRKKLRVGEFTEYVFDVELTFLEPLNEDSHDSFIDDMFEFLEQRAMLGGGFGGSFPLAETSGVITAMGRGSPTEEDREAVAQWSRARAEVSSARVLEFKDAWYGYTL
jgi:uncharacterized protein YggL (DUF469 family)